MEIMLPPDLMIFGKIALHVFSDSEFDIFVKNMGKTRNKCIGVVQRNIEKMFPNISLFSIEDNDEEVLFDTVFSFFIRNFPYLKGLDKKNDHHNCCNEKNYCKMTGKEIYNEKEKEKRMYYKLYDRIRQLGIKRQDIPYIVYYLEANSFITECKTCFSFLYTNPGFSLKTILEDEEGLILRI